MGFHAALKTAFRHKAVLLLGGNLGDPAALIVEAENLLAQHAGHILARSPFYNSEPWGNAEQAVFVNRALLLATPLPPEMLLMRLLETERRLGRIRKERWGPRTIDIDLLCHGQLIRNSTRLKLPHPSLPERRFALLPMSKVAAGWRHPVLGMNVLEMLEACTDPLRVWERTM